MATTDGHELPPLRLTPNLVSVAFGLAGLALAWSTAHALVGAPYWPNQVLWALAGLVWLVTIIGYGVNVVRTNRLRTELGDRVYGPFVAVLFVVPMLLSVPLAEHAPTLGKVVYLVSLGLTVAIGGWLSGDWIAGDLKLAHWHPGYYLPTVAAGLVGAAAGASLGYHDLARLMFGYGVLCWLTTGPVILLRLFVESPLQKGLVPTLAILLAPPVVPGTAWFQLNGNRPDLVALLLAGFAILMVVVQFRFLPTYRRTPFSPGTWAYSFSYAAGVTVAVHWLAAEEVPYRRALTYVLLALLSVGIAALTVLTIRGLVRHTFLPRAPVAVTRSSAPTGGEPAPDPVLSADPRRS